MRCLIISGSLAERSRSRAMAEHVRGVTRDAGHETTYLDLRELELPLCDAGAAYAHPSVSRLKEAVLGADGIIVATPIYNYGPNAAVKTAIELTGKAWQDKVVGFICAAGGQGSYMSIMSLANSLMLDFRCVIVPRFVYATGQAFDAQTRLTDTEVQDRLAGLATALERLARVNVAG